MPVLSVAPPPARLITVVPPAGTKARIQPPPLVWSRNTAMPSRHSNQPSSVALTVSTGPGSSASPLKPSNAAAVSGSSRVGGAPAKGPPPPMGPRARATLVGPRPPDRLAEPPVPQDAGRSAHRLAIEPGND